MVLLIKEELHHFLQVLGIMQARGIPYRKITDSRYAKGMIREIRTHDPATLIDKLICGAYIVANASPGWRHTWTMSSTASMFHYCDLRRVTTEITYSWLNRWPVVTSAIGWPISAALRLN